MSYNNTLSDCGGWEIECLATVAEMFEDLGVDMVGWDLSSYLPEEWEEVRHVARLLVDDLGLDTFSLTGPQFEEIYSTGVLEIFSDSPINATHRRLAPFRIFIEEPGATDFYRKYREHGAWGAYLACHMLYWSGLASHYVYDRGYHQSMFCGFTTQWWTCPYKARRIVSLFPGFRHTLEDSRRRMLDCYMHSYLHPDYYDAYEAAFLAVDKEEPCPELALHETISKEEAKGIVKGLNKSVEIFWDAYSSAIQVKKEAA